MTDTPGFRLPNANTFMAFGLLVFLAATVLAYVLQQEVFAHTEARKATRENLLRAERVLSQAQGRGDRPARLHHHRSGKLPGNPT